MEELSILERQQRMNSGETTAHRLAERYLERVEQFDKKGRTLGAVIERNPDALSIASVLDKERRTRGSLDGVPIMLKDNINTDDEIATTAGSLALEGSRPFPPLLSGLM